MGKKSRIPQPIDYAKYGAYKELKYYLRSIDTKTADVNDDSEQIGANVLAGVGAGVGGSGERNQFHAPGTDGDYPQPFYWKLFVCQENSARGCKKNKINGSGDGLEENLGTVAGVKLQRPYILQILVVLLIINRN